MVKNTKKALLLGLYTTALILKSSNVESESLTNESIVESNYHHIDAGISYDVSTSLIEKTPNALNYLSAGVSQELNKYFNETSKEISLIPNKKELVTSKQEDIIKEQKEQKIHEKEVEREKLIQLKNLLAMDTTEMVHKLYENPDLIPEYGYYYDVPCPHNIQDFIHFMEEKTGVPAKAVFLIINEESNYKLGLVSSTDDYGVMQMNRYWFEKMWTQELGWTTNQVKNEWIPGIHAGITNLENAMNYYGYTKDNYNLENLIGFYHQYINWRSQTDGPEYVERCMARYDLYDEKQLVLTKTK